VLLAGPATPLEPLLRELLMPHALPLRSLWCQGPLESLRLQDLLANR
jgi:membrane protein